MTIPDALTVIPLALIDVPEDRARAFDPAWVEALAASIAAQGLMHPIRVRRMGDRYQLVSGLRRLRACELNEQTTIPATVSTADSDDAARLEEVMENLGREELIALDRCHHLHELKVVWERMYPQAKHGGDRKSDAIKIHSVDLDREAEVFGFARAVAEQVGLSRSAISKAVKIWHGLSPASRARLVGTPLATKQTELKALSEEGPARQARILDLILGDDQPDIGNVAQALEFLQVGVVFNMHERLFLSAKRTLSELDDDTFDAVLAAHEDRVITSLKRRGRI